MQAAQSFRTRWLTIAWAHGINATLSLLVTSLTVYKLIHHPLIGTISELHAIIVWLKICSYAFTNRDLRHALLESNRTSAIPQLYSACPYPRNITLSNLTYFWWAPTLVYQPVYPRTSIVRWSFIAKRLAEAFSLSIFIWLASARTYNQNRSFLSGFDVEPQSMSQDQRDQFTTRICFVRNADLTSHRICRATASQLRFEDCLHRSTFYPRAADEAIHNQPCNLASRLLRCFPIRAQRISGNHEVWRP